MRFFLGIFLFTSNGQERNVVWNIKSFLALLFVLEGEHIKLKLLLAITLISTSLSAHVFNPVNNQIFASKGFSSSFDTGGSEAYWQSIEFEEDWTVIEKIHEHGITKCRRGLYTIGDATLW